VRIALVTADYQPAIVSCGVGDYTRWLRRAFEELGHQCLLVTSSRTRSLEKDVYALPGRWGLSETLSARRLLISNNPDAVILQYTPEHYGYGLVFKLLPMLLRLTSSRPIVVTTFHTLVGGRQISKVAAIVLSSTSHGLVSTHPEITTLFRRRFPWWSSKLREIPIGANVPPPSLERDTSSRRLRSQLALGPHTRILSTFGFPVPGKGLETLFEALRLLDETELAPIHLVCVGAVRDEDRSYKHRLDRLVNRLGIAHVVHWLGALPEQEVSDVLIGTDAYVVLYDEGASLRRGTLMAGFRIGIPIITTTPRYEHPSLRPGETVLAVPPRSPSALAEGVRALLADPALQERLRQQAAKEASHFKWPSIAAQYVEFIHSLQQR
jgi:glycosyltransferase involved in cell wall biosynthesis